MTAVRIAVLGDIHGNVAALEAALLDIAAHKPDRLMVTGDLALNGPRPSEVLRHVMELDRAGALVVQGNTDIAVADADYGAAFPWLDEVPASTLAAAEWAHDQLSDEQLGYLRRLPSERRLWVGETLILLCHASPGSQTVGLGPDLDPAALVDRATRTDARVICCGHTHMADCRELGRKLILNPGSCGYAFDGDPRAAWAMLTVGEGDPSAELFRTAYDPGPVEKEIEARWLDGDRQRVSTIHQGRLVRG